MRGPGAVDRPTVVIDVGAATAAALVVTERGSWLVPDPASGESRWPTAIHWDGQQMVAGAAAVQRGRVDPGGYRAGLRRALLDDDLVVLGSRFLSPVEAVAEFLGVLRSAAGRAFLDGASAPPEHAVVLIPPTAADPLRRRLIGAAEAAGFTGVELMPDAAAAVWAPGLPVLPGDLVLVLDCGVPVSPVSDIPGREDPGHGWSGYDGSASAVGRHEAPAGAGRREAPKGAGEAGVAATLVRVGEGLSEILGHESAAGAHPGGEDGLRAEPGGNDPVLARGRDLLARLGVGRMQVSWVVVVGEGARMPGLAARVEHGLGIAVATVDDPELVAVRGAAAWLPRSGPRRVPSRGSAQRLVPLAYTLPGHTARLLRWLVEPRQRYEAGAAVARVRLASGAVWDLTVRAPGVLDEVLVPVGRDVRSGEWLALVRPV